jgi:hypothetical protein
MRLGTLILTCVCLAGLAAPAFAHLHAGQGRFVQRDPAGYVDGSSLVLAYRSNPGAHLDPAGLANLNCPPPTVPHRRPGYGVTVTVPPCGPAGNTTIDPTPPAAGGADFSPAYADHDICYQDCYKTRQQCDDRMLNDLYAICDAQHPPGAARNLCHTTARVWIRGVTEFGEALHTDAQQQACICVDCW